MSGTHCGHPRSSVATGDEGTSHCQDCEAGAEGDGPKPQWPTTPEPDPRKKEQLDGRHIRDTAREPKPLTDGQHEPEGCTGHRAHAKCYMTRMRSRCCQRLLATVDAMRAERDRETERAAKLAAECAVIKAALAKAREGANGFVKRETYDGWIDSSESARTCPETAKVAVVLDVASKARRLSHQLDKRFTGAELDLVGFVRRLAGAVRAWRGEQP